MATTCLMGQTGPAAKLAGYGYHAAAVSGFYEVTGWDDRPPAGPFNAYTDTIAPRFLAATLIAALDHRRRTGEGQFIDQAQMESALHFLAPELLDVQVSGRSRAPRRQRRRRSPRRTTPTRAPASTSGAPSRSRPTSSGARCAARSAIPAGRRHPSSTPPPGGCAQRELIDRELARVHRRARAARADGSCCRRRACRPGWCSARATTMRRSAARATARSSAASSIRRWARCRTRATSSDPRLRQRPALPGAVPRRAHVPGAAGGARLRRRGSRAHRRQRRAKFQRQSTPEARIRSPTAGRGDLRCRWGTSRLCVHHSPPAGPRTLRPQRPRAMERAHPNFCFVTGGDHATDVRSRRITVATGKSATKHSAVWYSRCRASPRAGSCPAEADRAECRPAHDEERKKMHRKLAADLQRLVRVIDKHLAEAAPAPPSPAPGRSAERERLIPVGDSDRGPRRRRRASRRSRPKLGTRPSARARAQETGRVPSEPLFSTAGSRSRPILAPDVHRRAPGSCGSLAGQPDARRLADLFEHHMEKLYQGAGP